MRIIPLRRGVAAELGPRDSVTCGLSAQRGRSRWRGVIRPLRRAVLVAAAFMLLTAPTVGADTFGDPDGDQFGADVSFALVVGRKTQSWFISSGKEVRHH